MKTRRKTAFLMMVIVFALSIAAPLSVNAADVIENIPVFIEETSISPKSNNVNITASNFTIIDGIAYARASYTGYQGITTGATITIKLQKKILFWWFDVDNGQSNNTWTDVLYGCDGSVLHSLTLGSTGEYRAIISYTIRGTGGADDVIPITLYDEFE